MATGTRDRLRRLVDDLSDGDLDAAYDALRRLVDSSSEQDQADIDAWLVATGRMERIPCAEDTRGRRKIERLKIPGKPVSETIIEERR
ncbi:hypothetical protein CMK11_06385 [Candidatus Poribacteria bacterium]|jgi:hypothetical protein|nr:hypothetical protein [Candidatus Poribacteria bacterium]